MTARHELWKHCHKVCYKSHTEMEIKAQEYQMKQRVQTEISTVFIFHKAKELCQIPIFICFLQGAWANSPHQISPVFCLSLPLLSILSSHCRRCSVFHRIEPEKLHVFGSGWAPATLFFFLIEIVLVPAVQNGKKKPDPCFVSFCVWFLLERNSCIQWPHGQAVCLKAGFCSGLAV